MWRRTSEELRKTQNFSVVKQLDLQIICLFVSIIYVLFGPNSIVQFLKINIWFCSLSFNVLNLSPFISCLDSALSNFVCDPIFSHLSPELNGKAYTVSDSFSFVYTLG